MTVLEQIRHLPASDLATLLVHHKYEISKDWYFDEELEPYKNYDEVWITSYGGVFYSEKDAIQAQIAYLESSVESL